MRVVYQTVRQELDELIAAAALRDRRISHIELSSSEYAALLTELKGYATYPCNPDAPDIRYMGVRIKVVT